MTPVEKANIFQALHDRRAHKNQPLILYNAWDAATAIAAHKAGSAAIATGSWSLAAAHGYADGQHIPFDFMARICERIVQSVPCPVSVDFEQGYGRTPSQRADNLERLIQTGVVGINFEDQRIGGEGLIEIDEQSRLIEALANRVAQTSVDVFINARTDLFLQAKDGQPHAALLDAAIERASAYKSAGASGFFVPGLTDIDLISTICQSVALPVNIMASDINSDIHAYTQAGVARISFGPHPFFNAITQFESHAKQALSA